MAVLYAGKRNPYIVKNILPIAFMILINIVPLKEVVLNIIEATIRIDAIKPIISILFNLNSY